MAAPGAIRAGRAFVEIFADDSKAIRVMNRFRARMQAWSQQVQAIGTAFTAVGTAGLAAVGLMGGGALKLAGEWEQLGISLEVMLGSADQAKKVLDDLNKFAATTPFNLDGVGNAAKMLLAFGVSADDLIPTLRAVGDVASGIGAPLGDIAEIYGKARVQGRLFMEDINQLTGRGIPIIQELARQFGVSDGEVRKLVETGKVGFPNLEQAFVDLTTEGAQFGGMMDRQSKSLFGLISTLKDAFASIGREIGAALLPTIRLAVVNLTAVVEATTAWVKSNQEIVQAVVWGAGLIATGFAVITATGLGMLATSYALAAVAAAVGLVAKALVAATAAVMALPAIFTAMISPVGLVGVAIAALGAYMLQSSGIIGDSIGRARVLFADMSSDAITGWQGIVDAIAAGDLALAIEVGTAMFRSLWTQAVGYVKSLWADLVHFGTQVFIEATSNISGMFIRAFYSVQSAWTETVSAVTSLWDRALSAIREGWQHLTRWIAGIAARVMGAFGVSVDLNDVQKELDAINRQELDGIAATSAARQDAIQKDRADRLAAIDAERQGALEANEQIREQRRESADQIRDNELENLQERVRAARGELAEKAAQAARRRLEAEQKVVGVQGGRDRTGGLVGSEVLGDARSSVIGTFSARAAGGMSASTDYGQQIANGVSKTNELLKRIKDEGGAAFN